MFPINLEYALNTSTRYGYDKPPHQRLDKMFSSQRSTYEQVLKSFLEYKPNFTRISKTQTQDLEPYWLNVWVPPLDGISLYSMIASHNPNRYVEIGSGISTMFARRAVADFKLRTRITSIDPAPRIHIDPICDATVRQPLDNVDLGLFSEMEAGDILFVDGSHYIFANSDVTIVFLDILPRLNSNVLVAFHDIFLPSDYPPEWSGRHYSEQWMLAACLLAEQSKFEILFPSFFVINDEELRTLTSALWQCPELDGVESHKKMHNSAFWLRIK